MGWTAGDIPDQGGRRGHPSLTGSSRASRDASTAKRLWDVSVELTGVDYAALELVAAES
jgi:hypothetical protein